MSQENEISNNNNRRLQFANEADLERNSYLIKQFIEFCKSKGIHLNICNFDYIPTIGVVCRHPNILLHLNSNIKLDKEELLDFNTLDREYQRKPFASGFFYCDKYMAMANSYFRREYFYANSLSTKFIEIFCQDQDVDNDKYISLDLDRVRVNVDDYIYKESDIWFGAKFKHQIETIKDGIVKLRPPSGLREGYIDMIFGGVYALDIEWYTKGNIKVFQCEEFRTESVRILKDGQEFYPVKYIHAEFDLSTKTFRHFDGAIHFYTNEEYMKRRETDFNHNDKSQLHIKTLSQKLFKINGSLSTEKWIELTSHFLSGNYLVLEYFEGKLPDRLIKHLDVLRGIT